MSELSELYQQVILDHNKKPRNFKRLETATREQEGYNPLCGDQLTVYLEVDGETIKDVAFQGSGCAISKASASMMTVALKGKSKEEAVAMFEEFHHMVKGELDPEAQENHLGRLKIFAGVREFPARVKCASLCWHTLRAALEGSAEAISTE
jgi:nitrogen fixation NifU-like protein